MNTHQHQLDHNNAHPQVNRPQTSRKMNRPLLIVALAVAAGFVGLAIALPGCSAAPANDTGQNKPTAEVAEAPDSAESDSESPFSDETQEIIDALPSSSSNPQKPAAPELAFTSFTPTGASVMCNNEDMVFPMDFAWTSQNAVKAWFGIDTQNAKAAPYQEVDPSGSITANFFCSNEQTTFTVTLEDASGTLAHHSIVVERD